MKTPLERGLSIAVQYQYPNGDLAHQIAHEIERAVAWDSVETRRSTIEACQAHLRHYASGKAIDEATRSIMLECADTMAYVQTALRPS